MAHMAVTEILISRAACSNFCGFFFNALVMSSEKRKKSPSPPPRRITCTHMSTRIHMIPRASKAMKPARPPTKKPKSAVLCSLIFHHSSDRPLITCPSAMPRSVEAPVCGKVNMKVDVYGVMGCAR